jgi:hypothetical protein
MRLPVPRKAENMLKPVRQEGPYSAELFDSTTQTHGQKMLLSYRMKITPMEQGCFFFKKLTVAEPVKKFPAFCRSLMFIATSQKPST